MLLSHVSKFCKILCPSLLSCSGFYGHSCQNTTAIFVYICYFCSLWRIRRVLGTCIWPSENLPDNSLAILMSLITFKVQLIVFKMWQHICLCFNIPDTNTHHTVGLPSYTHLHSHNVHVLIYCWVHWKNFLWTHTLFPNLSWHFHKNKKDIFEIINKCFKKNLPPLWRNSFPYFIVMEMHFLSNCPFQRNWTIFFSICPPSENIADIQINLLFQIVNDLWNWTWWDKLDRTHKLLTPSHSSI
jgi:hypothetical protein